MKTEYTIDATGKKLGRVAAEAAALLMGKTNPDFRRNTIPDVAVTIVHVSKLDVSEKKRKETEYVRYSGYPGGLKTETMEAVIAKKGYTEIMRKAVYGMLPSNRLRARMLKNLTIEE